jgi:hypothetical protein
MLSTFAENSAGGLDIWAVGAGDWAPRGGAGDVAPWLRLVGSTRKHIQDLDLGTRN